MRKFLIAFLLCTSVGAQGTDDLYMDSFSWSIVGNDRVACVVVLANTGRLETLNHVLRLEFYDKDSRTLALERHVLACRTVALPSGKQKFDVSLVVSSDIARDTAGLEAVVIRCDTNSF